ncbi:MAG: hypothetical protein IPP47_13755 [Bryobacterales bacterium]|nr:hypothetical protein [Bryobacterales bacterium]
MNRKIYSVLFATALAAVTVLAQGPQGPGTPGAGPSNGPGAGAGNAQHTNAGLNMAAQSTVEGAITSVQMAYGTQYPSIVVGKAQIKVAPVWYLLENDFELAAGEVVSVVAAPSNTAGDAYLYAIRITKGGASITLRDELGIPAWTSQMQGRSGREQGPASCGTCIDLASTQTASGVIDRVTVGVGIQQPTLVLKLADATLLTVKLGSERLILASDFELNAGEKLTVKYARSTCTEELVALELTDANGKTLTLRN